MKAFLEGVHKGTGGSPKFTWVSADFLEKMKVAAWSDMPVWVPGNVGLTQLNNAKAVAAGLTFRPVSSTAKDTLAWFKTLPEDRRGKLATGITADKEQELLAAWHAKKQG